MLNAHFHMHGHDPISLPRPTVSGCRDMYAHHLHACCTRLTCLLSVDILLRCPLIRSCDHSLLEMPVFLSRLLVPSSEAVDCALLA